MKISYIAGFYRHYSTERYVAYALRQAGAEVQTIRRSLTVPRIVRELIKFRPDVVLFCKGGCTETSRVLDFCRENGITTVSWLWDLYWGLRPVRGPIFEVDLLLTTDGGHDDRWPKKNHITLRQGIHEPEAQIFPGDYHWDVGFVGNPISYRRRERLVNWLERTYQSRFILHTHTRGLDLNKALAQVKVVVGDSFPSPNYWSNRVYEITGRGGFLLHPVTEGLDQEFTPGIHYVGYPRNNLRTLKALIDTYVKNDEARERIRLAGFRHCLENYTYTQRAKTLLDLIKRVHEKSPRP